MPGQRENPEGMEQLIEDEYLALLSKWNATQEDYPGEQCIHQLFEAQVERTPGAIALISEREQLTYLELNQKANQLAHHLYASGVGPEVLVGLCMDRSVEMVVGLLGVLKAGGAYVPLDPAYPAERLAFMLRDSQAAVLLTKEQVRTRLPEQQARLVSLDTGWACIAQHSKINVQSGVKAYNLAYIIYTSGSTGRPKGVAIEHRALVNHCFAFTSRFQIQAKDRVLQFASLSFDAAAEEIFPTLLSGATLILRPAQIADLSLFLRFLEEAKLTILNLPTSYWHLWVSQLPQCVVPPSLRIVVIGGEKASPERFATWRKLVDDTPCLVNTYGPTEATITTTIYEPLPAERDAQGDSVPIGRPIANAQLYVLDAWMQRVPIGVVGELFIGGAGLARGYLNRHALTAEKFVPDPFGGVPGARLYRTGDLVHYLADGSLEFVGRVDHQVKIRGFRVELEEIEAVLAQHPTVREAVVMAQEDAAGTRRLVAYVVADAPASLSLRELRRALSERLPDYMLPSAFRVLDALPLTPGLKVDRHALATGGGMGYEIEEGYVAPGTPTEKLIADIWVEVLGKKRIGISHTFFEVGGNSLVATQIVARMREAFHVEFPLRLLFDRPTIAGLAAYLETVTQTASEPLASPLLPCVQREMIPLSLTQQGLWLIEQLVPGTAMHTIPLAFQIIGQLNLASLQDSLMEIARRHAVLRTRFAVSEGEPVQVIAASTPWEIEQIDLRMLAKEEREAAASQLAHQRVHQPFDLCSDLLLHVSIIRLEEQKYLLLMNMHHLISDGWSIEVFLYELRVLYNAYCQKQSSPLAELAIQYADFTIWQRQWLQTTVLEGQLAYWKQQLVGAPALLSLPTDHPRPALQRFRGAAISFFVPRACTRALKALSQQEEVTLFMTLLAAWQTLLFRYTGQEDLVVGTPTAGRTQRQTEELIGFFVNMLVLRTDLSGNPRFQQLLQCVRETALQAYAHQEVPFEQVVEALQPARDLSFNPLFQVAFVLQNSSVEFGELLNLQVTPFIIEKETTQFDLTLELTETAEGLEGHLEYNTDLFEATTISRMVHHFQALLEMISEDAEQRIGEIPFLGEAERQQLLIEWNATQADYPGEQCIHQLFEAQVERTPEAVALVADDRQLTYQELNGHANRLAHRLQELGVEPEVLVGVCMERSVELIVALLAILKAGGAYVPLSPRDPRERIAWQLQDTQANILLTHEYLKNGVLSTEICEILALDTFWAQDATLPSKPVQSHHLSEALAYVMYTSGSTGKPKGVAVTHRNIVRLILGTHYATFDSQEIFLHYAPIAFDASTFEIWGALLHGARLVIAPPALPSLEALGTLITRCQVSTLWLTAELFHQMVDSHLPALQGVRQLLAGGDRLSVSHVCKVLSDLPDTQLINGYGPTEGTTFSCCATLESLGSHCNSVPIGRPIANTQLYVLDAHMQPVPIGVVGELFIGGAGLARGYLNRPELTAEKFVPNPFSGEPGTRLYRTGDRVRYLPDGDLEFLGRLDHQIKIRGFRVELGEIEAALAQYPYVQESVVVLREGLAGEKQLVGYVTAHTNGEALDQSGELLTSAVLRHWLQERLPVYAVPAAVLLIEKMPLTSNGKLDRRALPTPDQVQLVSKQHFVKPRTAVEEILVSIWSEVLGVEQVSLFDDFFALGGHSLLATKIITRLRKTFQVELPLQAIFDAPTPLRLSQLIESTGKHHQGIDFPSLQPGTREKALPLSFAQQRLWFFDQLNPGTPSYNTPMALRLHGTLNAEALEHSLDKLIQRHEILRTTFVTREGKPIQVIALQQPISLQRVDLSALPAEEREHVASQYVTQEARHSFDLARGPLLRVTLLPLSPTEHILVVVMHHIITDGWSLEIFMRELLTLYDAFVRQEIAALSALSIQYADYAIWQRTWLEGEILQKQLHYWKNQLIGIPTVLALPIDHPRPKKARFQGSTLPFTLSTPASLALKRVSQQEGVTLFMTLLAGFQILLSRYTQQEAFLIGTPMANRSREELEALIGFFVNTIVVRADLRGQPDVSGLLKRIRETLLGAYAHQDLPFERLVEELQPRRALSRNPLFQVLFDFNQNSYQTIQCANLTLQPLPLVSHTTTCDLILSLSENSEGIRGSFTYDVDLFDETTIVHMITHYLFILEHLAEKLTTPVNELLPLTASEIDELQKKRQLGQEEHAILLETTKQKQTLDDHRTQLEARQTTLSPSKRTLLEQRLKALSTKKST